ncbi:MAG: rhodanese-like domain-containing protein [Planctomycetota bacterium]
MQTISRDNLKEKIDRGDDFVLVEVLDHDSYADAHLPQAINIPIHDKAFGADIQNRFPDKSREVVVYCANTDCDASPRAAEQMERLGYEGVIDYPEGKQGWRDAGLPIETGG